MMKLVKTIVLSLLAQSEASLALPAWVTSLTSVAVPRDDDLFPQRVSSTADHALAIAVSSTTPSATPTYPPSRYQIYIRRARLTESSNNEYLVTTNPYSIDGHMLECSPVLNLQYQRPGPENPGVHVPAYVDYSYYAAFWADYVGFYSKSQLDS